MAQSKKDSVEVTYEDQQNINTFSKLNAKMHELEAELSIKQEEVVNFEDAGNELMLIDEEEVPYSVGECFFRASVPEAEGRVEEASTALKEEITTLNAELAGIKNKMAELKTVLYGRLGRENINLEE